MAAEGGVILKAIKEWIRGFSEQFGVCTSIKAALCGLYMAYLPRIKKLWFQANLMIIVGMLRGLDYGIPYISDLLFDVRRYWKRKARSLRFYTTTKRPIKQQSS